MNLAKETSTGEPVLVLNSICKSFGRLPVLNEVSLSVAKGERHALLGTNGAGKTTLLNIVSGDFRATSGQVFYEGENISTVSMPKRARMGIGRTYQIPLLFEDMTVEENVMIALGGTQRGLNRRSARAKVAELLSMCHLEPRQSNLVNEIAHGEKKTT